MRIRHIVAAGAAATALSLGAALPAFAGAHTAVAHPAAAHPRVHVYVDANYKGTNTIFTKNVPNLKKYGWNDCISSAHNQGNRWVTFYSEANYHGAHLDLGPGGSAPHFGNTKGMADTTSSIRFS